MNRTLINVFNRVIGMIMVIGAVTLLVQGWRARGVAGGPFRSLGAMAVIILCLSAGFALATGFLGQVQSASSALMHGRGPAARVAERVIWFLRAVTLALAAQVFVGELHWGWGVFLLLGLAIAETAVWRLRNETSS